MEPGDSPRVQNFGQLDEAAKVETLAPRRRYALTGDGRVTDIRRLVSHILNQPVKEQ